MAIGENYNSLSLRLNFFLLGTYFQDISRMNFCEWAIQLAFAEFNFANMGKKKTKNDQRAETDFFLFRGKSFNFFLKNCCWFLRFECYDYGEILLKMVNIIMC